MDNSLLEQQRRIKEGKDVKDGKRKVVMILFKIMYNKIRTCDVRLTYVEYESHIIKKGKALPVQAVEAHRGVRCRGYHIF
jgi:hypothetical protein